ncbi:MAG: serine/threonine protein kinase [Planctomycetaceae bacterium]|nr:serine/threonine protein kinase [Planctomycetaceae bacterium]
MDDGSRALELLLRAVQHGLLTRPQVDECLHAWEQRYGSSSDPGSADHLKTLAMEKGFLNEARLKQLESGTKDDPALTRLSELTMVCGTCSAERGVTVEAALRKPRCAGCSGVLHFRRPGSSSGSSSPGATKPRRPVSEEVRKAMEDPKARFAKYVLLSKLGTGGMGEVWRAWDTVLYRMVALKFPRTMGEEEIRRLHLEAQGAGGLSHPNIASIYEIAEADGRHYIAMQYISGKTAEDSVKKSPRPPVAEIVRWVRDAALGVHYAHESGVIHRDLKPANVMIDTEGRVFVMDFGLAKLTSGEGSATVSGVILGTPAFMPPEQAAANAGQVDRRSDVYSLGAMAYVLLSGRRPFEGESATDILVQILTSEPAPLKKVWPEAPWELDAILSRAMARARDQRYETAKAFADDLDRYLSHEPIKARRQSFTVLTARKLRKRAGFLLAIGSCVLLLAVAAAFYVRSSHPPAPAPAGPDRLKIWAELFPKIQTAVSVDTFDAAVAAPLLERMEKEFPEQGASVNGLIEGEHRDIVRAIEQLPRARWLESAARVRRFRDWLAFMKKPVDAADRILAYRGTITLTVQIVPYAELRGTLVESLPPEERVTPLTVRGLEIREGTLEITHPQFGSRRLDLPLLKNGMNLTVEGQWKEPDSIKISEGS